MPRFISPPRNQLDRLKQPLQPGERLVFDFFDAHLPLEWEIYIQPHLNGLRPDFVLLNPRVGIGVFEIKDWNFEALQYSVRERTNKSPLLIATKDGKTFSLQRQNPIEAVHRYKQELYELYCPRLNQKSGLAVITAGVIFPFAPDDLVRTMFAPSLRYRGMAAYPSYHPISGSSAIQRGEVGSVFPEALRHSSKFMSPQLANDLRNWLVEPDFAATQREPLELDSRQLSFVNTRTSSGYRRIKGPAGSGKSLVLAARAAELIGQGKSVLVVTFNITLCHYLMDLAVRYPNASGQTRSDVTWLHFHAWCKRVCFMADHEEEYKALWQDYAVQHVLEHALPALVNAILDSEYGDLVPHFDAVLVDEGQDFLPSWWNILRRVCNPEGEMLLVADATQDVYGTARTWTDEAMLGAGFRGAWAELKISYRLPPLALKYARIFASEYLPREVVDLPEPEQAELDIYPCHLRWVHTDADAAEKICMEEFASLPSKADPEILSIPDIVFLTDSEQFGFSVVTGLDDKGVHAVHTFSKDKSWQESRRRKIGFFMGDARVKATTLHSFKGWESRALILYIGQRADMRAAALIYTGLTRVKRHVQGSWLTVVSSSTEFLGFGRSWPDFEDKTSHQLPF